MPEQTDGKPVMVDVILSESLAGRNHCFHAGDVIRVPQHQADRLVRAGQGVIFSEAVLNEPEVQKRTIEEVAGAEKTQRRVK